jgi:glycosyltransferase involved in cell wall biosynthesis
MTDYRTLREPRVSVGLPVYNGANYLSLAIESILAQTYGDFELVISDNASTDDTPAIVERFSLADDRIRSIRNESNLGGARNANNTFKLARGEFFRWAGHDDLVDPRYLEACVEELDRHQDVVLACPGEIIIDEAGRELERILLPWGAEPNVVERVRAFANRQSNTDAFYGLMRASALRRTRLLGSYVMSDRILLCELAMLGRFGTIPEFLFMRRVHPKNVHVNWRARKVWFDPNHRHDVSFPNWAIARGYASAVIRAPIDWRDKLSCGWIVATEIGSNGHRMAKDLVVPMTRLLPGSKRPESLRNWE